MNFTNLDGKYRQFAIDSVGFAIDSVGFAIDSVGWATAMFKEPKEWLGMTLLWRWADQYHELALFFHDNDYQEWASRNVLWNHLKDIVPEGLMT